MLVIVIKIIFVVTIPGDKRIDEKENKKMFKNIRSLKEKLQRCGERELSRWYQLLWDY